MNKNLTTTNQNSKLTLIKVKDLLDIAKKLLSQKDEETILNELDNLPDEKILFAGDIQNCNMLFNCPLKWENLNQTKNHDIRYCSECKENVYRTYSEEEFRKMSKSTKCVYLTFYNDDNDKYTTLLGLPAHRNTTKSNIDEDEIPF